MFPAITEDELFTRLGKREQNFEKARIAVKKIKEMVLTSGDDALIKLSLELDGVNLSKNTMKFPAKGIEESERYISPSLKEALDLAFKRIFDFHEKIKPQNKLFFDDYGNLIGKIYIPIESVGVYIPGGSAAYPSSVLMNIVPALVAGVKKIVAVTPPKAEPPHPAILYALKLCNVTELYTVGGAQAIFALAYGTDTIPKVDKIVGPGNVYVAEAKREVSGVVGIDGFAGPSEVVVIADNSANPRWVAADLLAQAEHDENSTSILLSCDESLIEEVRVALESFLATLESGKTASSSLSKWGGAVKVKDVYEAIEISNRIAPEHLELMVENPRAYIGYIKNAGAVFLGPFSAESLGDYIAGPSHVLPTGGTSRFSSGLSTEDFMKATSLISVTPAGFYALSPCAGEIAKAEGLPAHHLSLKIRNGREFAGCEPRH
ncbi:MAG: histidinol dehydrogenase [Tepidanaerobacteraceae bacterium]|nr:histidinol dehydrogenase [Tepidanaerobacteraceae bacterium]